MKLCSNKHNQIIYKSTSCPLCALIEHDNEVHDFIEANGYEKELYKYQQANRAKDKEDNNEIH